MIKIIKTCQTDITVEDAMGMINDYVIYGNMPNFDLEQKISMLDEANRIYAENMNNADNCYVIKYNKGIKALGKGGRVKAFVKKVIKKCIRWYIMDMAEQQTYFNAYVLRAIQAEERILRIIQNDYKEYLQKDNECDDFSDSWYIKFEDEFRGESAVIRERMQQYIPLFAGMDHVLDLGCGRGEFLSLLKQENIRAKGVDINKKMVEECLEQQLDVYEDDAIHFLEQQEEETIDGIFSSQLVEHLKSTNVMKMLGLAYQKLKPGGICVIETVNPLSLGIFCYGFYLDPTHSCPIHPATLRFMAQSVGFFTENIYFINVFPEDYHFKITDDMTEGVKAFAKKMDEQMFGAQDYYIVCRKREKQ